MRKVNKELLGFWIFVLCIMSLISFFSIFFNEEQHKITESSLVFVGTSLTAIFLYHFVYDTNNFIVRAWKKRKENKKGKTL